jgi:translocation and assembly module TamA
MRLKQPPPYEVSLAGVSDETLRETLVKKSRLFALRRVAPETPVQLRQRMDEDRETLRETLIALGYYAATVQVTADEPLAQRIVIRAEPGRRFTFGRVGLELSVPDGATPPVLELGIKTGEPATAPAAIGEEARLLDTLRQSGYPDPVAQRRSVHIDRASATVDITFRIACGAAARFGNVSIRGADRVNENYVRSLFAWATGDVFAERLLRATEKNLLDTGVFSLVVVRPLDRTGGGESLPIDIELVERKRRSMRLGGGYQSDRGPVIAAGWMHRNVWGSAQSIDTSLLLGFEDFTQRTVFKLPRFLDPSTTLMVDAEFSRTDLDAYDGRRFRASAALTHDLDERWSGTVGVAYKYSDITQQERRRLYGVLSYPLSAVANFTDSRADPRSGWRTLLSTAPSFDVRNDTIYFKSYAEGRAYVPLSRDRLYVLALRSGAGFITGTHVDDVPPDERFYAGGGGSVRGYSFQSIGPKEDGVLVGGMSLFECSAELRYLPPDDWGYVVFLDGGTAYDTSVPGSLSEIKWGIGFGTRYDLGFSSLRVDVGVPAGERFYERAFQFYISIGEAF